LKQIILDGRLFRLQITAIVDCLALSVRCFGALAVNMCPVELRTDRAQIGAQNLCFDTITLLDYVIHDSDHFLVPHVADEFYRQ